MAVERRGIEWSFSGYDFTPFDDPANTEHVAEVVVEVARNHLDF